jgi:hypothetical protein
MFTLQLRRALFVATLATAAAASAASGQVLHVNHEWDDCAIVLAPGLTQHAWHQFVSEVGVVMYFRPMTSAKPLGKRNVEFAVLRTGTRIDDQDAAWNDTFSHPDSTHWLFDGDALQIPGLMLRMGVTDRIDAGVYFTKNPNSNYGFIGGQVQYAFLDGVTAPVAAAGRLNVVTLFGPEDVSATVYGADVLVSKDVARFLTPYAGISGYLSRASEKTSTVNLDDENVFGVQGMLGISARVSVITVGAELNLARVMGYSFKVGVGM